MESDNFKDSKAERGRRTKQRVSNVKAEWKKNVTVCHMNCTIYTVESRVSEYAIKEAFPPLVSLKKTPFANGLVLVF
jgi:hypothetical protein